MANPVLERRVCRVLIDNDMLLQGFRIGSGTAIVKIVPAVDRYDFGNYHWLFLAHEDLSPVECGAVVPEYKLVAHDDEENSITLEPV